MSARHSGERRNPVTENINLWTSALLVRPTAGRGSNGRLEAYGIKKLRGLILELAAWGRLVARVGEWRQIQLGDFGDWAVGNGFPKNEQGKEGLEILFAKVSDMNLASNEKFIVTANHSISMETAKKLGVNIHPAGTVVFPKIGGAIATNKRRILMRPTAIDNNCLGIIPRKDVSTDWLYLVLSSIDLTKYQAGTSVPALAQGTLEKIKVLLPPFAEQQGVVAKVDELMALCDQLEQEQGRGIEAHQTLVETLLGALTNVESSQEFAAAWSRIAEHFDTLFTTEHSIDQLKQTILQLAVMGKLVPQDVNDERAHESLAKVIAENVRCAKQKTIEKQDGLSNIEPEEIPYELPQSWVWARLPEVAFFQEGPGIMAKDFRDKGVPLIRIAGMHNDFVSLEGCNFLQEDMVAKKWAHFKLELGDIVLSSSASLGKVAKVGDEAVGCIAYTGLIRFQPFACLNADYLIKFLSSSEFESQINKSKTGAAIMHFGPTHLKTMLVPIAPLGEQHRIVAKVDELMTLCDALKARLSEAQTTQIRLADAIVERAVA